MLRKIFTLIFFTFSYQAIANVTLIECNSCTNYNSYINKALSEASSQANESHAGFTGEIVVLNPVDNKANAWYIDAKWVLQGGDEPDLQVSIYSRAVSSDVLAIVEQLHNTQLFRHFKQAKSWGVQVPEDSGLESAWDISRNFSNHDKLDNWYHSNYPISYWTRQVVDIAGQLSGVNILVGHQIKFVFSDGTTARFKVIEVQTGELTFTYIANTARDKEGNRLADQGTSFAGEYTFKTEQALTEFLNRLAAYGVPIRNIIRTGGAGTVTITVLPISPE